MTNVEKAARELATRMLALCQQFLDNGRAIRIAGPNATTWLQVTDADIEGEFSIDTEGGSTQAVNPATRANQGRELITAFVPMLAQLGYDPEPTLRTALQYMGLNPDHMLVRAQMPAQPVAPEAAMGGGQMDPETATMMAMGAPPVPAATEGGLV
jgi:hypothetical protein